MVYFFFLKMLCLLWQICDIIGLIFIVAIGQNWKLIYKLVTNLLIKYYNNYLKCKLFQKLLKSRQEIS